VYEKELIVLVLYNHGYVPSDLKNCAARTNVVVLLGYHYYYSTNKTVFRNCSFSQGSVYSTGIKVLALNGSKDSVTMALSS
jgi:uncharacterized membrane protein YobD (UPF0266 family)